MSCVGVLLLCILYGSSVTTRAVLYNNWFVSSIVAVSTVHSTLLMSAIICVRSLFFGALVAVVLSVWILVPSALDSNCVVVEEFLLWQLDLVE